MRRLVIVICALLLAAPALAQHQNQALADGVARAADLQLSREGSYLNANTGVGNYDCAWEWVIGTGTAYVNTQGPSVLGLLEAYESIGKWAYLKGAVCAANQMVARYDANTARPYPDDVIFLTELAEATHNHAYRHRAVVYHTRVQAAFPTGAALADYYISSRLSLAGWDLAAQIHAALAVHQEDYAQQIAEELIARRTDWEGVLYYDGTDYTLLSQGFLVGALGELEGKTVRHYRDETLATVLAAQDTDGSWDGDFQTTAYVLMSLERSAHGAQIRRAIAGGVKYLLSTETPEGGWSYPPEFGEVNGEVLSALAPLLSPGRDDDHDRGEGFENPKAHWPRWRHAIPHR